MSAAGPPPTPGGAGRRFRRTLARVLAVQAVTLGLLWLLQVGFSA